jgi:branched-chain amino acid transport system substrate-binding protein
VVGATAASVRLRELKPGYIWFTTSAIPDKLAAELHRALRRETSEVGVDHQQRAALSPKRSARSSIPSCRRRASRSRAAPSIRRILKDMTAMLTQIKQANPDAVLALSYPGDSALYAKQAKELGIAAPIQFVAIGPTEAFFAQAMGKLPRASSRSVTGCRATTGKDRRRFSMPTKPSTTSCRTISTLRSRTCRSKCSEQA